MDPLTAAKAAIAGTSPSQAPAAPAPISTAMPAGINANGTVGAVSGAAPAPTALTGAITDANNFQQSFVPSQLATKAIVGQNSTDISNAYNAFQAQRSATLQALSNQANAASNYKQVKSADGGYNFFDDQGKPITAFQYAAVTAKGDVPKVLAGSQNPVDQQYINDHSALDAIQQAYWNGGPKDQDKAAQAAGFKDRNDLHNTLQQVGITTPQQLNQAFMNSYPQIWGANPRNLSQSNIHTLPQYNAQGNNLNLTGEPNTFINARSQ